MKIRSIRFYLQEGVVSLFKNRLMTLASIAIIAACIMLFICSYCGIMNINYVLEQVESTIGITVFPQDDLSDKRLELLEKNLAAIPNVTAVRYISPEEALKMMEEDFGEDASILEGFESDNPLSKSYEISISAVEQTKSVIAEIKKLKDVRKIREAEDLVSVLIDISNILSIVGLVVVAVLSIISIVIVMNTIKLTVYVRHKEINIMKYVGATDWFIRWPFIIEGILIGLIGAAIPVGIGWFAYQRVIEMASQVPVISGIFTFLEPMAIFPTLAPICLGVGAFLGMCGSIYSVRKHLKV